MILACDIGSTHTKIALLRNPQELREARVQSARNGAENSIIYASYRKHLPLERQDGQSFRALLPEIADTVHRMLGLSSGSLSSDLRPQFKIEALSFSGHGPSLIAINRDGLPVAGSFNPVHRTAPQIASFRRGPSFYLPLARVLMSGFNQQQYKQLACILPPINYICFLLTGECNVPIPEHYTHFYWPQAASKQSSGSRGSEDQRDYAHESDSQFLRLLAPLRLQDFSAAVGRVQSSAIQLFGLPAEWLDLPVFCPGVDFFAGEAGLSHCSATMLRNRTGTSEGFNLLLPENRSRAPLPPGYFLNHHVISQEAQLSYVQEGGGNLFDQLFRQWQSPRQAALNTGPYAMHCAAQERIQKSTMLQELLETAPSAEQQAARHFARRFVASSRPCTEFFSALKPPAIQEPLPELPRLGLYTLYLLLEYFTVHCHRIFTLYRELTGSSICSREVLLTGTQAYYPYWLRWKAQHSGISIHVPSICDAEFVGAAALCYYQLGYFPTVESASSQLLEISRVYE